MNYGRIYKTSILDGPGCRVSLYVSGCGIHCPGCHNSDSWDFHSGEPYSPDTEDRLVELLARPYIRGLSILGGEPYDQIGDDLERLAKRVKETYPDKDIWVWTGHDWGYIKDRALTRYADAVVVGRFVWAERDVSDANRWRGSRNQRVVDVKASLESGKETYLPGIPNND